jgi:hypothetical protein
MGTTLLIGITEALELVALGVGRSSEGRLLPSSLLHSRPRGAQSTRRRSR